MTVMCPIHLYVPHRATSSALVSVVSPHPPPPVYSLPLTRRRQFSLESVPKCTSTQIRKYNTMLSPRLLAAFALVATVAAVPVSDKPGYPQPITTVNDDEVDDFASWFRGPWDSLFSSVWNLIPSFADIGPRIVAKDDLFQVIVNVKKYKASDLTVKVKGDFVFVQGSHEAKQDESDLFASQFFHTYSLPANFSGQDVTAKFYTDGYLVVSAPLKGSEGSEKAIDREVPITETGTAYSDAAEEKPEVTTPLAIEDDNKEQTTPSVREDATEKDNVIPHGEAQP